MDTRVARIAFALYGGLSVIAAGAFFVATSLLGGYPTVARIGGSVWILVLTLIVTMPLVIPRVKSRLHGPAR
ncbi:MAG: hypothetical protein M1337_01645 [Actinobacteria bacterium]|nr:hypothetical protein [Actinomycetota bacterium]